MELPQSNMPPELIGNDAMQPPQNGGQGLVSAPKKPHRLLAGLRYRLTHMTQSTPPLPPQELRDKLSQHDPKSRQMSFTFSVIALSARVATADGPLTMPKYLLFRESFPLEDGMCSKIRSLFILACHNDTPLDYYLSQIRHAFPGKDALLATVLDRLFAIASADGDLSARAENLLADIARGLDIRPGVYSRLLSLHLGPRKRYHVLGLKKRAAPELLKSRYRELMRTYHPDRHAGAGLSQELEMLLQLKSSEINAAYHALAKRAA